MADEIDTTAQLIEVAELRQVVIHELAGTRDTSAGLDAPGLVGDGFVGCGFDAPAFVGRGLEGAGFVGLGFVGLGLEGAGFVGLGFVAGRGASGACFVGGLLLVTPFLAWSVDLVGVDLAGVGFEGGAGAGFAGFDGAGLVGAGVGFGRSSSGMRVRRAPGRVASMASRPSSKGAENGVGTPLAMKS